MNLNGMHALHQNQWTLINELQHHNPMKTIRFLFEMNKIRSRIYSYKIAYCTCWLAIFLDFLFQWTCQESIIMNMLLWIKEHTVITCKCFFNFENKNSFIFFKLFHHLCIRFFDLDIFCCTYMYAHTYKKFEYSVIFRYTFITCTYNTCITYLYFFII